MILPLAAFAFPFYANAEIEPEIEYKPGHSSGFKVSSTGEKKHSFIIQFRGEARLLPVCKLTVIDGSENSNEPIIFKRDLSLDDFERGLNYKGLPVKFSTAGRKTTVVMDLDENSRLGSESIEEIRKNFSMYAWKGGDYDGIVNFGSSTPNAWHAKRPSPGIGTLNTGFPMRFYDIPNGPEGTPFEPTAIINFLPGYNKNLDDISLNENSDYHVIVNITLEC